MKNKKYLFSSGEFARLNGINKRTLHYYNDIGLFCPEVIGENGYHYYTCFQTVQLELILTLRRIGLSIDDIKSYVNHSSEVPFHEILDNKKMPTASQLPRPSIEGTEKVDNTAYI